MKIGSPQDDKDFRQALRLKLTSAADLFFQLKLKIDELNAMHFKNQVDLVIIY